MVVAVQNSREEGSRRRSPLRERSQHSKEDRRRRRRRREGSESPRMKGRNGDEYESGKRRRQDGLVDKDAKEKEEKALQEEMEKRRRRVEAWQRKMAQKAEEERQQEEEGNGDIEEEGNGEKKWNLEDEGGLSEDEAVVPLENVVDIEMNPLPRLGELNSVVEKEKDGFDALLEKEKKAEAEAEAEKPEGGVDGAGSGPEVKEEEEDVDPLDAFMEQEVLPEVKRVVENQNNQNKAVGGAMMSESKEVDMLSKRKKKQRIKRRGYLSDSSNDSSGEGDETMGEEELDDEEWARRVRAGKLSKSDKIGLVDHSKMDYAPFRRNFYIEVPEIAKIPDEEVQKIRQKLDIKVRGKSIPKPIKTWVQCGLSSRIIEVLRKGSFDSPLPIQAQAIPAIMGGRDCISVAKTGSGKTLAFVLPLLRHVKDQRPLAVGDGPIGIIMAPTRELVTQIGKEVRKFSRVLGMNCTCVYGGSGIANQISELKRGSEIVVCTPGRMIDILASGPGKITNLTRVTFLVMDEADRMFDMGFEPQIMRIVNNIRPDRQTVLFSATFPRSVEMLARHVLTNPIEIQLGGRSVVNPDITQIVEIRPEEDRFLRLLQVLGEWYEKGKLLVFVSSQDRCDTLFRDLLRAGYPCLSLHGGKDQSDRQSTISDFKSSVCNVLVATSVAARGLDVKDLVLVVNYDCPNHHEEYVHRVGRTGRAGNKGTAITFISTEEEQYAPDLVKALRESGAQIPYDLASLAQQFTAKRKAGLAKAHASGFGGSGYKFDNAEDEKVKSIRKSTAKEYGVVEDSESDEEVKEVSADTRPDKASSEAAPPTQGVVDIKVQQQIKAAQAIADKFGAVTTAKPPTSGPQKFQPGQTNPDAPQKPGASTVPSGGDAGAKVDIAAAAKAALHAMGVVPGSTSHSHDDSTRKQHKQYFEAELEINDFPQNARWRATHRETLRTLGEQFGSAVVVRGRYVKPGTVLPEGERKLYLQIEGPSADIVKKTKSEIKRILEESTEKAMRREAPALM